MSLIVLICVTLIVIYVVKYVYTKHYKPAMYWKDKGVPHLPTYPFVGSFAEVIFRRVHISDFALNAYKSHPDKKLFGLQQLGVNALVVRDSKLQYDISTKYFDHFVDRSLVFVDLEADPLFTGSLFGLKGEEWQNMRHLLTPSFTSSKLRGMFSTLMKCNDQLTNYFNKQIDNSPPIFETRLKPEVTKLTNDIIATIAFGLDIDSFENPDNDFFQMGVLSTSNVSMFRFFFMMLFRSWFATTKKEPIVNRKAQDYFRQVIFSTIKEREEKSIRRPDMLDLLIENRKLSIEQAKTDKSVKVLTDIEIAAQAFLFFFAGFETTSNLLGHACFELLIDPTCQKRLQDEIDNIVSNGDGSVTYEQLNEMKYLDAVVKETLRKWPSGVGWVDRRCTKDLFVKDAFGAGLHYTIEKGATLHLYSHGVHMDEKNYPNPEKFDPERFYERKPDPEVYYPFGAGPRNCLAVRFGALELKAALFTIFKDFDLVPTKNSTIPIVLNTKTSQALPKDNWIVGIKKRHRITANN